MKKAIATALMAAMMTVGTVGASFAAGLGTIDMAALLQKHPNYPKAMAQWRSDVEKAQKDFQDQVKKEKDPKAQQELAQKFNVQLNKQRSAEQAAHRAVHAAGKGYSGKDEGC